MCLFPREIRNKSRFRHPEGFRNLIQVKCGHCSECRKEKELEYQHRAWAEYRRAQLNGGYTLFWTLTYDDENVPLIGEMRVFSREHIRKFRLRLNTRIKDYKDALGDKPFSSGSLNDVYKLIIVSEYGGLTHRPHYHMLVFIQDKRLDVFSLHRFIQESWYYGESTCGRGTINSGIVDGQGAIDYVSKYISKDDSFSEQITLRHELSQFLDSECMVDSSRASYDRFKQYVANTQPYLPELGYEYFKLYIENPDRFIVNDEAFDKAKPFHVQSQGFGLSIIDIIGRAQILKDGCFLMPDNKLGISAIPIPQYIQRHLIYDRVDVSQHPFFNDGKKHFRYVLNADGLQFKLDHLDENLDRFAETIKERIQKKLDRLKSSSENTDNQRYVYLSKMLNSNNLQDFARYCMIYRGNKFLSITGDYREDYQHLILSNASSHNSSLVLSTIEFFRDYDVVSQYIKCDTAQYYKFAGIEYKPNKFKYYHESVDDPFFEVIYDYLRDDETQSSDKALNDYHRSIRAAKARQKLQSEGHLIKKKNINHIILEKNVS